MYPLEVYSASSVVGRGDIRPVGRRGQPQPPILGTTIPYNTIPHHMCTIPYPYTTSLVHPYLDHNFDSTMSKCIYLNSKLYSNIKRVIHMHSPNANVFKPKPLGQWCSQQQRNLKVHQYSWTFGVQGKPRYISISDDVKIKANMILKIQSCRILSLLLMFRNAKTAAMQKYRTTTIWS